MNDIEMIPLGKLRLSEANVRKNDSNLFIEELAANIEAKGLLQNLIVAPAKKRGMFDVTARPFFGADTLTFAVPMRKLAGMVANAPESFLVTDAWARVRQRIGHKHR